MTDEFLKLLDEKIADASANIASCERMGFPHAAWSQQVIVCEALRTAYLAYREKLVKALEQHRAIGTFVKDGPEPGTAIINMRVNKKMKAHNAALDKAISITRGE